MLAARHDDDDDYTNSFVHKDQFMIINYNNNYYFKFYCNIFWLKLHILIQQCVSIK